MKGTYVTIAAKDGGSFKAYLAKPEKGSGPGVVLLQEIFGINQYVRDVADYYAEEGYVVIAPDLFWRLEPGVELNESQFEKAFGLYQKFDVAKASTTSPRAWRR
jgi:carboxymethylenebutenolidase